MRLANVWMLSFQVAICLAAATLTESKGVRDPAACQIIDCSVSMAPHFCPIKCSPDPEICRIVDCSHHQSETFCPRKCSGDKEVVTYGPPASNQSIGDEVIFISGGFSTETSIEVLDVSDVESGCSRLTSELPDHRYGHSMDLLQSTIIICGGYYTETSCIGAESPLGPWSNHSVTTGPRSGHSSAIAGGTLHLLGGSSSPGTVESLDGNTWREGPAPPYKIGQGSCSVKAGDNVIIVMGGWRSERRVAQLDVNTNVWIELASLNMGRRGHGCAVFNNNIVVAGGQSASYDRLKSSEIYSISENRWQSIGDMNQERSQLQLVTVNTQGTKRVFAVGGQVQNGYGLDSIEELTGSQVNDFKWTTTRIKLKQKRNWFAAVAVKKENYC